MKIPRLFLPALFAACIMASCSDETEINVDPVAPPQGAGPKIRESAEGGVRVNPGGNAQPLPINATPQNDIVFTDPDNPDAGIPELENLMAAPKRGPWEESETIARQTAAREGKPILIWFTDSARSPMCKILSAELFSKPEFEAWAADNVVRLRVDSSVSADDPDLSLDEKITRETEMKSYVARLKKRYRVLGHPSVLMLNPSGEVIERLRGYKRGDADYFWGLIKQNTIAAQISNEKWRKDLESKGYRDWRGESGRKVFAKLASYSKGTLILIEPGGERFRTQEKNLSSDDKKWLADQKALRGIE
jgi:thioredoxin-related protein